MNNPATQSCGNVFADLALPNADLLQELARILNEAGVRDEKVFVAITKLLDRAAPAMSDGITSDYIRAQDLEFKLADANREIARLRAALKALVADCESGMIDKGSHGALARARALLQ